MIFYKGKVFDRKFASLALAIKEVEFLNRNLQYCENLKKKLPSNIQITYFLDERLFTIEGLPTGNKTCARIEEVEKLIEANKAAIDELLALEKLNNSKKEFEELMKEACECITRRNSKRNYSYWEIICR